ncbi:hypothetical protein PUN28_014380 [Cardiocondyla obscurior]|uniref:Uncharacterized protein n=1 Tax=Cardiocondyla obscurior TaxID=286306 RepID=A0AAW2EZT6_9HYME
MLLVAQYVSINLITYNNITKNIIPPLRFSASLDSSNSCKSFDSHTRPPFSYVVTKYLFVFSFLVPPTAFFTIYFTPFHTFGFVTFLYIVTFPLSSIADGLAADPFAQNPKRSYPVLQDIPGQSQRETLSLAPRICTYEAHTRPIIQGVLAYTILYIDYIYIYICIIYIYIYIYIYIVYVYVYAYTCAAAQYISILSQP